MQESFKSNLIQKAYDALTEANLEAYLDTEDRFIFCADLLGLSLSIHGETVVNHYVEALEQAFGKLFINIVETTQNKRKAMQ